ncbi:MAG TPA: corrinoid protein [Ignavibacteriaceae bacterium]|nr:corrinoid protein [Ignavibacteriaceae bacterium]
MENILDEIAVCVERGKSNIQSPYPPDLKGKEGAFELTQKALENGIKPSEILNEGLIKGMQRIGEKFRANKVFVPDVLIAAKAMNAAMVHIKPFFISNEIKTKGKIVMGTVAGDLHDIGKNIVAMIIQGGGWEIVDLGVDVSAEKFVKAVEEHKPAAIGLSALLTTTMLNMESIIKEIKTVNEDIKVLVGGAPLSQEYADSIGADFFSPNPQDALEYLNGLNIN